MENRAASCGQGRMGHRIINKLDTPIAIHLRLELFNIQSRSLQIQILMPAAV